MNQLAIVAVLTASLVAGTVLHEATHYIAALMADRDPQFNVWEWEVAWPAEEVTLDDVYIGLAPTIVGVVLLYPLATSGLDYFAWFPGWVMYTAVGIATNDLSVYREYRAQQA